MSLARRFVLQALLAGAVLAGLLPAAVAEPPRVFDGVGERVAGDPVSGFALFGYDPVAYFVEGRPRSGKAEHEWRIGSATFRFASEGNRAAFIAHPEVYIPAYGGYDAEAMETGVAVNPDPEVFVVQGERLYLFRSAEARQRFLDHHDGPRAAASWAALAPGLEP